MSHGLISFVAVVYWVVAIDQLRRGHTAGFVVWGSYGMANWGLLWLTK